VNGALATRSAQPAAAPECALDGRWTVVERAVLDCSGPAAVVAEHAVAGCSGPAVAVAEHAAAGCSGPAAAVAEHAVAGCSGPAAAVAEHAVAGCSGLAAAVAEHAVVGGWLALACCVAAEDGLVVGPAARAERKQEQRFRAAKTELLCW